MRYLVANDIKEESNADDKAKQPDFIEISDDDEEGTLESVQNNAIKEESFENRDNGKKRFYFKFNPDSDNENKSFSSSIKPSQAIKFLVENLWFFTL